MFDKRCYFFYVGSEEEDKGFDDDEFEPEIPIPRSVRILFEADEDSPQEAEATKSAECAQNVHKGDKVQRPTSLFDFNWQAFPTLPMAPHLRREKFVATCGPKVDPISSPYDAFILI